MRGNLRLFFGVAAVPGAAIFLFVTGTMAFMFGIIKTQLAGRPVASPHLPAWVSIMFVASELILVVVYTVYLPAAVFAAMQSNRGIAVSVRQAFRVALPRFGRYLWLMILGTLYIVVPVVTVAALIGGGILLLYRTAGTGAGSPALFLLIPLLLVFYLCVFVYGILIMLRFALAYPASVEENLPAWAALTRSVQLTRGARGRIFLVMLVVYAVTYALQLVIFVVLMALGALGFLGATLAHVTWGSPASFVLAGLGGLGYLLLIVAITLICYSALTAALSVLYHDQRLRKDGSISAPAPVLAG
jgi:hypothetical protein